MYQGRRRACSRLLSLARSASSRPDSLMPLAMPRPYLRGPAGNGTTRDAAPVVEPRQPRLLCKCMPLADFNRDYGLAFGPWMK